VRKMLAGLTSRWTMPAACAASRASATWEPTRRIHVVQHADVGVGEDGGGAGLALEALAGGVVLEVARGEELEGDAAGEAQILRLVDDPHAALAQRGGDPIVGDRPADHGPLLPAGRSSTREALLRGGFRPGL
jgi:hypothetical protein